MGSCTQCGVDIRWAEVAGAKMPLDSVAALPEPGSDYRVYRLVSEDQNRAEEIHRAGIPGYRDHRETCRAR